VIVTRQTHAIADGQVFCPKQVRFVDFERCLGCPLLQDIDVDSRHPKVTCRLPTNVDYRLPLPA